MAHFCVLLKVSRITSSSVLDWFMFFMYRTFWTGRGCAETSLELSPTYMGVTLIFVTGFIICTRSLSLPCLRSSGRLQYPRWYCQQFSSMIFYWCISTVGVAAFLAAFILLPSSLANLLSLREFSYQRQLEGLWSDKVYPWYYARCLHQKMSQLAEQNSQIWTSLLSQQQKSVSRPNF